jgi:flagellar hook-associated protein 3 FlgL
MRITTNMIRRNYQNNLNSTMNGLEQSRKQVETGRRFNKSYEDPSAAARGSILETRLARNADYTNTVKSIQKWQDTQEDTITQLSTMAKEIDKNYSTAAMSDASGETGRSAYAQNLRSMQQSMVITLNAKYGNAFVMAGSDGTNAPFKLTEEGNLLYRGLDVNDPANSAVMKQLSQETAYVDLGYGLTFSGDEVVSSSAFNSAFPGVNVVGYGQTADGTSKNLIVLAGQMADILEADKFDSEAYEKLWTQFNKGSNELRNQLTEIGTKSQLLDSTLDRLVNEKLNITEQYTSDVNINEAEAIMNYSWAQYVYNAALKIGTSIFSQSLVDFLR